MDLVASEKKVAEETLRRHAGEVCAFLSEASNEAKWENTGLSLQLIDHNSIAGNAVSISAQAVLILTDLFRQISKGEPFHLLPENAELSTQQAAAQLNVSRPYLISLLEKGLIPFRKVGKHRRVLASDLARYRQTEAREREKVLAELAEQAQELDMGY